MRSSILVFFATLLFAAMVFAAPADSPAMKRKALKQYDMRRATPVRRDDEFKPKPKPSKYYYAKREVGAVEDA